MDQQTMKQVVCPVPLSEADLLQNQFICPPKSKDTTWTWVPARCLYTKGPLEVVCVCSLTGACLEGMDETLALMKPFTGMPTLPFGTLEKTCFQ